MYVYMGMYMFTCTYTHRHVGMFTCSMAISEVDGRLVSVGVVGWPRDFLKDLVYVSSYWVYVFFSYFVVLYEYEWNSG